MQNNGSIKVYFYFGGFAMKKRILSVSLALAVMLVSLPVFPLAAKAVESTNDITIVDPETPVLVVDRVISNFNGLSNDSTVPYGEGTIGVGIGTNTQSVADGDFAA